MTEVRMILFHRIGNYDGKAILSTLNGHRIKANYLRYWYKSPEETQIAFHVYDKQVAKVTETFLKGIYYNSLKAQKLVTRKYQDKTKKEGDNQNNENSDDQ